MTRRVVITGLGTVCPLANDIKTYWEGLLAGRSGISLIEQNCARGCHKFGEHGQLGLAPDLTGYGSYEWMMGFVSDPTHERFYRQENDRDYGQEAIEILLQIMENQREDLVVILAGYKDRMETFFQSNPGVSSRIAHHLDFPDYSLEELMAIAQLLLTEQMYHFSPEAQAAFEDYLQRRMQQPRFSNARSVRNALDRARLRQANRILARGGRVSKADLMTIEAEDVLASRVFTESTLQG